jgi:glycosyltransferase involved in cell wall biosynthesis
MTRRILVVTPWKRRWEMGNRAGVADDYYFIDGFRRAGFEVHYLAPADSAPPDIALDNYHLHTFPNVLEATARWPSLFRRPAWPALFTTLAVRQGLRVARAAPPSLILGQTHLTAAAVRILAKRLGVPSVVKLFGVIDLDRTDWSRWKYARKNAEQVLAFKVPEDAWIVLDDGTGGDVAALRHGVPRDRLHWLPNGVNLEWADRAPDPTVAARYSIPPGTAVVLYIARLTAWKRPDALIRAVPRIVATSHRPVRILIAGDGPSRESCEALVTALGVASSVRLLGAVPHDEVPNLFSIATVFASTNERSNLGIPTCEAMTCGVPVVAFDVGNTRAVVRDRDTGRLVPDGDGDALADAIASLVNDTPERDRLGARARQFARETFTGWPERVGMEVAIVERLIERAR